MPTPGRSPRSAASPNVRRSAPAAGKMLPELARRMVTVHPFGLSNVSAAETLIWREGTDNGGAARLWRGEASGDYVRQDVEVRRLDELGSVGVDVIKIDIEGAEMLAIEGAAATIDRDRPILLSEVLPADHAAEAHRRLAAGGVRGRLVLSF